MPIQHASDLSDYTLDDPGIGRRLPCPSVSFYEKGPRNVICAITTERCQRFYIFFVSYPNASNSPPPRPPLPSLSPPWREKTPRRTILPSDPNQ